jgi:hypothetical protein
LQALLDAFRETGYPLKPGATRQALEAAEKELDCTFPESIRAWYEDHDGMSASARWLPMRLMSLEEVIDFHAVVLEYGWDIWGLRVFWTDDSSNYAGLYITGPLAGKVCWIDHSEIDPTPVYASVRSFLRTQLETLSEEVDWEELPRDYPAPKPSSDPERIAQDEQILQTLRPLYAASEEDERIFHAYCIMALTPFEQIDALLAFTYDEDSEIQARVCDVLGQRRYEPAIERLAEIVLHGAYPNAPGAAIRALGSIGSEAARARLLELSITLPKYSAEIRRAMRPGR